MHTENRANANQSEQFLKKFTISFVENSFKINTTQSESSIRMNPNQNFNSTQSEWLCTLGLNCTEFSIRINLIKPCSDQKFGLDQAETGLILIEKLISINLD